MALIAVAGSLGLLLMPCRPEAQQSNSYTSWEAYGGTSEDIHYSSLSQINRENVKPTDAVVVGMYDTYIDQSAVNAE